MSEKEPSLDRAVMIIEDAQVEMHPSDKSKFELIEEARDELNMWLNAHDGGDRPVSRQ